MRLQRIRLLLPSELSPSDLSNTFTPLSSFYPSDLSNTSTPSELDQSSNSSDRALPIHWRARRARIFSRGSPKSARRVSSKKRKKAHVGTKKTEPLLRRGREFPATSGGSLRGWDPIPALQLLRSPEKKKKKKTPETPPAAPPSPKRSQGGFRLHCGKEHTES